MAGELGLRFYAGAPLRTSDGHNLGTLCVIGSRPRTFSDDEAELLTELAGVVMDELELRLAAKRAVGHELSLRKQAERMARALQDSLLPPALPAIDGAELAALYRPADAAVIGGDFYDAFVTKDASALAVGDVSGKGSRAAAVTGLARHTIRTAALGGAPARAVLGTLNRAMFIGREAADVEHFCTALLILARRTERGFSLDVSTAGHPPALVVRADGSTGALDCRPAPPAGWYPGAVYHETTADLGRGDAVVLFTDGLTEARTARGRFGSVGLERALRSMGPGASASEMAQQLDDTMSTGDLDVRDDVAALVFRVA